MANGYVRLWADLVKWVVLRSADPLIEQAMAQLCILTCDPAWADVGSINIARMYLPALQAIVGCVPMQLANYRVFHAAIDPSLS